MRVRFIATTFAVGVGLLFGACTAEDGAKGPPGTDGVVGDQGPKGNTGPAGATGATGEKGETGDDGVKGPVGDDGPKGETGDTGQPGNDAICAGTEPLIIFGTTGLPEVYVTGQDAAEFTIDVETESGTVVTDGLDFVWLSTGPDLVAGTADNAFTVPTDTPGSWAYDVWVTDGCHVATWSFTINVEDFVAHVSAVNLSSVAGDVDLSETGGDGQPLFSLSYLAVTEHVQADVTSAQLDLDGTGLTETMTLPEMTFEHRGWYTIVIYDDAAGDVHVALMEDAFADTSADDTFGLFAFNVSETLGTSDLVDRTDGNAVLFEDMPYGDSVAAPVTMPTGVSRLGVDRLGDGSVDFGYLIASGPERLVFAGETATLFMIDYVDDDNTTVPAAVIRTAAPGIGTTYGTLLTLDPLAPPYTYDAVAGEGTLAPTSPSPLGLPIESGSLTYDRTVTVSGCAAVSEVVVGVEIPHEYRNDLNITLTSPDGTTVLLNEEQFVSGVDFIGVFIDGANAFGEYEPDEALSTFAGETGNGDWTLSVEDTYSGTDDGVFDGWSLNLMCDDT